MSQRDAVPNPPLLKIVEGAEVFAPEPMGVRNVLVAGGRIACIQAEPFSLGLDAGVVEVVDGRGKKLVPGFIDGHVHILGGGGEGGYASRTPEIMLTDLTLGGVTTVVGCLGTDGTTRTMANLVAKARGLEAEGLTTRIYTGAYQVPVPTLTGSVMDDIVLIDKVVGVGEVALSDHRSSQPTFEEIARIAAAARVGGMLSGKAGVVNVHLGDGARMLSLVERIIAETEIPARHFVPTHVNRNERLFQAAIAYAKQDGGRGRYIDLTSSSVADDPGRSCGAALKRLLEDGVSVDSVSFSSDGQGSLPVFNHANEYVGLGVGKVDTLFGEVRKAVQDHGIPLQDAIKVITTTPAGYLQLAGKGVVRPGADADLVLLDADLGIHTVMAMGQVLVGAGRILRYGTFEQDLMNSLERKRAFGDERHDAPGGKQS
ncbi:MAG TPA: beta-aspartyl-peptidase [Holophaga sp.]|nr:beta-aspartyl-peptidase [Holophaga sp.]HPS66511.1 beta-aspartyl-peptidase [Holophaga sp.]